MKNSRDTAPDLAPTGSIHAMRRAGIRREVSERVTLASEGRQLEGWSLNMSRGGIRIIVEGTVALGEEFDVVLGGSPGRRGRIAWIQEEPDGVIAGLEFVTMSGRPQSASTVPGPRQDDDASAGETNDDK